MADTEPYTIDGLRPTSVERPLTVGAVSEFLAGAEADGLAVAPVGGGGALHLGNPIEGYDLALDLTGLDRVLEHHPTDLVLSVQAGIRLGELRDVLARHGQWLPIEAPYPDRATIGGLIATALSGPGRATHGSLRDALIGIAVAGPSGGVAKAGGMVVKNVSGFDLMRLHHGALGTLGVVVTANFKVLPMPPGEVTVLLDTGTAKAAHTVAAAARALDAAPSAVVVEQRAAGSASVALRFEGRATRLASASKAALATLGGEARTLPEDESRAWWQGAMDRLSSPETDGIEVRFGTTPSGTVNLSRHLEAVFEDYDMPVESWQSWPDLGTFILRVGPGSDSTLDTLIAAADAAGATWRVMAAPVDAKRGRDVWGQPPAALDTIRRLKQEFDRGRILNPGRFCGHL